MEARGGEGHKVLVGWDTDRVKSYVFATSKLREIRGASAILADLNEQEIPKIIQQGGGRLIYAGGGSAMGETKNPEQAKRLIQEVERVYRSRTVSAEITGAMIEMNDPTLSFGEYARQLNYVLRVRKDKKSRERAWRTSPVIKVCGSCAQYPAEHQVKVPEEAFICESCKRKRDVSKEIRNGRQGSLLVQLLRHARDKRGQWHGINIWNNAPEDFTEIGEVASPPGYVGFIYCDGNRMGELLSGLPTRGAFTTVSKGIRETLNDVLFDALCIHFRDLRGEAGEVRPELRGLKKPEPREDAPAQSEVLPFEIIFVGGDDLVLVVAADKAVEIAIYLCREFERRTSEILRSAGAEERERLSLSVAVLLAPSSLPIYHLQRVADDLLESAKRKSLDLFEAQGRDVGCVDFHVITASASELPSVMRKADWVRTDEKGSQRLTERPYTADDLDTLLLRIRALKATNFPQSKLQMVYESIMDHSMTNAMATWAFVSGRARKSEDWQKDQFGKLADFFQPGSDPLFWPWCKRDGNVRSTPMVDVVELYDFIRTGEQEERKRRRP